MSDPLAIGIDLGTTYSVIARIDEAGVPATLANAEGERLTPSAVLFDAEDSVVVGREALKALASEPDRVAECAKRDVGYSVYHKTLGGKQYPPEVIEAFILNKLRFDATAQVGDFSQVVITVPAYFDEVRRKATQDAGYMAGLEVMDIINEPTAAALAFGYQQKIFGADGRSRPGQRLLIYDLGGGTFDVTVMDIEGTHFRTLATDGDVRLGGYDWDQRLVDLAAEAFIAAHDLDPRDDAATAGRLWRECEDAKRTLSSRARAAVHVEFGGKTAGVEVSRAQFEEATADLLDRTRFTTQQAVQAAGSTFDRLDRVLLVGGATRMPMVRRMLESLAGKPPETAVAADEAVALGAALRARQLLEEHAGQVPAFTIRNVNSHSLGVVGIDPATRRKRNGILIPRNTPLPVTGKRTFRTHKDNQRSILVRIVEGESALPEECLPVGKVTVSRLPEQLPKRTPVDIHFRYKANGRLKVRVSVPTTGANVEAVFKRENILPKEHLDGWREFICGLAPTDYR